MTFAPIAIAASAVLSLHTLCEAATFQSVSGTDFTAEPTYSVLRTATSFSNTGTIGFAAPVTSFTLLWGSPDSYNHLADGALTVTGSSFSSGTGNNAESTLYPFVDALGFTSLRFSTTGVSLGIAEAHVPEPMTFALLLAGIGAVGFMTRRRGAPEG